MKKFLKFILAGIWGKKAFQGFFEKLFFFSLRGMNIGGGSTFSDSGELNALEKFSRGLGQNQEVVLFDVGANKGEYTLAAALCFKNKAIQYKILAFEPSPSTFTELAKNLNNNPDIKAYNLGLGSAQQTAVLYSDSASSGMASLYKRDMSYFKLEFNRQEQVAITTLDKFCLEHQITKIDFLKLDVEGNELEVLKGAKQLLAEGKISRIQFEFGGADIDARVYLRDFVDLLKGQFVIYRILKDGLRVLNYTEWSETFVTTNFLAVNKNAGQ